MSAPYQVMYRLGFTPWDNHDVPAPLAALIGKLPVGRLLDVGCGTGADAIWCAGQGWDVTGIDAVSVPVRKARRSAAAAGANVRFLHADIARIAAAELGSDYSIVQDIGCFAGLDDADRARAAATITEVAAAGARFLMFAFGSGGGGRFGPRRLDASQLRTLFPAWDIEFSRPADEVDVKGPMRDAPKHWHQLVKG